MSDRFLEGDIPQNVTMFVGRSLQYAIKSPDLALFDFGFAEAVEQDSAKLESDNKNLLVLHISSALKIIWRNGNVIEVYGDAEADDFDKCIQPLLGLVVRRCALSNKNDLWLDFGIADLVVVTIEDGEESWRMFLKNDFHEHIIASDLWILNTGDGSLS